MTSPPRLWDLHKVSRMGLTTIFVSNAMIIYSQVMLEFREAVDLSSVSPSTLSLQTPSSTVNRQQLLPGGYLWQETACILSIFISFSPSISPSLRSFATLLQLKDDIILYGLLFFILHCFNGYLHTSIEAKLKIVSSVGSETAVIEYEKMASYMLILRSKLAKTKKASFFGKINSNNPQQCANVTPTNTCKATQRNIVEVENSTNIACERTPLPHTPTTPSTIVSHTMVDDDGSDDHLHAFILKYLTPNFSHLLKEGKEKKVKSGDNGPQRKIEDIESPTSTAEETSMSSTSKRKESC
ncbi:hypothetical protein LguiA_001835 [Lonicera macranthoides]